MVEKLIFFQADNLVELDNNITSIHLDDDKIYDTDVEALVKGFKVNETITSLYLKNNRIGSKGAKAIAEMLAVNQSLRLLHVCGNPLYAEGIRYIAEVLKKENKTLTHLSVGHTEFQRTPLFALNPVAFQGIKAIAEMLEKNKTLCEINLSSNYFSSEGIKKIMGALKVNESLQFLDRYRVRGQILLTRRLHKMVYRLKKILCAIDRAYLFIKRCMLDLYRSNWRSVVLF